jgi:type IV pilus assembly protein PilB
MSFARGLRAILRQDPDIVMVGEIRDLETADIAIKAAQTGHMVMSTLHTNNAPATLARLLNMGVPAFNIVSAVNLITAQRLARRLCTCKQPAELSREALLSAGFQESDFDGTWVTYKPVGCDRCKGTGYKGRVGIYEVMPVTAPIQDIILRGGSAPEIARQAERDGVKNLRQSGLLKARQGLTSVEEVLGCTNE